jgi:nitrite reductase/ring-hydroxylating ferredoxin subunit/uncharacterized membrane protein
MGHPLHPILIAFPIAFLVGALLFDLAGYFGHWAGGRQTGAYLSIAAVISGLIAAVPGVIDFLGVVPPKSSAWDRALWHMGVNVAALTLFAVGWAFRDWDTFQPNLVVLLLEAGGVALVGWGGYMGGTLVYRNQIGVDHRYANAGKWRETTVTGQPGESVVVAKADEFADGQMMLVHANGQRLVLARHGDRFTAFDDYCTHKGGPLADGVLACGVVTCPWHGSQFDVKDGSVSNGPAEKGISTYQVKKDGNDLRLVLPDGKAK